MTECEQYREWISQMLDGELSEPQKTELMTHLAVCGDCARVYDALAFLSASIDGDAEPPAALREDVMRAITAQRAAPPRTKKRRGVLPRLAALAACLAVVIFAASRAGVTSPAGDGATLRSAEAPTQTAAYFEEAPARDAGETGTAAAQGENTQPLEDAYTEAAPGEPELFTLPGDANAAQNDAAAQAMDVSVVRLFSGQVEEPQREPILTVTSQEALTAMMELLEFSETADAEQLSGDPVFVVSVVPIESDEYTVSVWITDGKLYCVDDRDGTAYVAAGDASDLFAMIADA